MSDQNAVSVLPPEPPLDLREAGRRLWEKTVSEIEFQPHELELLGETCRTLDAVRLLQQQLDTDGVIDNTSAQGRRVNPCLPELRQQRIVLARLLAALAIPDDEPPVAGTTPAGRPRGTYRPRRSG